MSRSESYNREKGAVLVLVEVLAVILLMMAGFAIDQTLVVTSQAERRRIAENAAVESLDTFAKTAGDAATKLEAARTRAEEIAQISFFIAKPLLVDNTEQTSLGTNSGATPTGENGRIVPGNWHFAPADCSASPAPPSPCPCSGGKWSGPCFQELDLDADPAATPNSFRVELNLSASSPLKRLFARVQGFETADVKVNATASVVTRQGVFLVDLSRSTHATTHMPYETAYDNPATPQNEMLYPAESAFRVTDRACPVSNANPCNPFPVPPAPANICGIGDGPIPGMLDALYESRNPAILPPNRPGAAQNIRKHYRSDYSCYPVRFTDTISGVTNTNYLVDTWSGATTSGQYDGPEPLMTILHGINHGVRMVENQGVPGDMLGMIGYDHSAKVTERQLVLSSPGSATFNELRDMTTVTAQTAATKALRYRDHAFFPRANAMSNLPEALETAVEWLQAAPNEGVVRRFIMIFSDGLTNCTGGRVCGNDEASYIASRNEALNIMTTSLPANNITLSFSLFGEKVKPHTILTASISDPRRCMMEDEARAHKPAIDLVNADGNDLWTQAMRNWNGRYWQDPNRFYFPVASTGGVWGPLRDPCPTTSGDPLTLLNQHCAANPANINLANQGKPTPLSLSPATDADGRLVCDPYVRSRRRQIEEYVAEAVGTEPYIIVR